jgi:hypothetical protein
MSHNQRCATSFVDKSPNRMIRALCRRGPRRNLDVSVPTLVAHKSYELFPPGCVQRSFSLNLGFARMLLRRLAGRR